MSVIAHRSRSCDSARCAPAAPACPRRRCFALIAALVFIAISSTGCVRRTLTITSEPEGALCWINGREVGRTPVTVDFTHYGKYDVQLTLDDHEPLLTEGDAKAPLWDSIPLDLAAELWPSESHSDIRWHYVMQPRLTDRDDLIDRASELRERLLSEAPTTAPATAPTSAPATTEPAALPAANPE